MASVFQRSNLLRTKGLLRQKAARHGYNCIPKRVCLCKVVAHESQILRNPRLYSGLFARVAIPATKLRPAVVVANHSSELDHLQGKARIYFAEHSYAEGILEGIEHYNFIDTIRLPGDETDTEMGETYLKQGHMIRL